MPHKRNYVAERKARMNGAAGRGTALRTGGMPFTVDRWALFSVFIRVVNKVIDVDIKSRSDLSEAGNRTFR
jgi:hypothetical protein